MMRTAWASSQVVADIKSKGKRFSTMEIQRFAVLAGLDVAPDATVSVMTPFFRGLEEHRGSKAAARTYVEEAMEVRLSRMWMPPHRIGSLDGICASKGRLFSTWRRRQIAWWKRCGMAANSAWNTKKTSIPNTTT
jgi:hypothetical protein